MVATRDILFWTPIGLSLQNPRIYPVINIAELVDYVILSHNAAVADSRVLKAFIGGLAELGIDKDKEKEILD